MNKNKIKGKRVRIGRRIFLIAASLLIPLTIIISLYMTTVTTEGKEVKSYKRIYSSMLVPEGSNLWDIAKNNCGENETSKEYTDNIKKINNMTDDTIYEGMSLIYYYYAAE